jgi:hypothetical protein
MEDNGKEGARMGEEKPGCLGVALGVRAANMERVNSEGREFMS